MASTKPLVIDEVKIKKGSVGSRVVKSVSPMLRNIEYRAEKAAFSGAGNDMGTASVKTSVTGIRTGTGIYKAADKIGNGTVKFVNSSVKLVKNPHVKVITTQDLGNLKDRVAMLGIQGVVIKKADVTYYTTYRKYVKTKVIRSIKTSSPARVVCFGGKVIARGGKTAVKTVVKTVKITKGVLTSRGKIRALRVRFSQPGAKKEFLKKVGKVVLLTTGKTTLKTVKTAGKGVVVGIKASPKIAKSALNVSSMTGGYIGRSDNAALQVTGQGIQTSTKAIKTGTSGVRTVAKGAVKTGKGAVKAGKALHTGFSYARQNGMKKAAKKAASKAGKAAGNALKNLAGALVKGLGKHILVPIIIIICAVAGATGIVGGAASAVGSLFGSFTNIIRVVAGKDPKEPPEEETIDEETFLHDSIKKLRKDLIGDIQDELSTKNMEGYHVAKFYNAELGTTVDLDPDMAKKTAKLDKLIYSESTIYEMIQPAFHVLLLRDMDEQDKDMPEIEDMERVFEDVTMSFMSTMTCDKEEWCNGGTICPDCGRVHMGDGCYNPEEGYHDTKLEYESDCKGCCKEIAYKCKGDVKDDEFCCGLEPHSHDGYTATEATNHFREEAKNGPINFDDLVWHNWKLVDSNDFSVDCWYGYGPGCNGHEHNDNCKRVFYHWSNGEYWAKDEHGIPDGDDALLRGEDAPSKFNCWNNDKYTVCKGYHYCKGHKVKYVYFSTEDAESVINERFEYHINEKNAELETFKDDEDKVKAIQSDLQDLEDYRELCYTALEITRENLGVIDDESIDIGKMQYDHNKFTDIASAQVGKNFSFGSSDPGIGFDDLGLVKYVYSPYLDDVDDYSQLLTYDCFDFGHSYYDDKAGALILYTSGVEKVNKDGSVSLEDVYNPENIYHVGISLGNGYMIHAAGAPPKTIDPVTGEEKENKNPGKVRVSKVVPEAVMKIGIPKPYMGK